MKDYLNKKVSTPSIAKRKSALGKKAVAMNGGHGTGYVAAPKISVSVPVKPATPYLPTSPTSTTPARKVAPVRNPAGKIMPKQAVAKGLTKKKRAPKRKTTTPTTPTNLWTHG